MNIAFPVHVSNHGRLATSDGDEHIADMIEQLLFTDIGERVNRPDFGCSIRQLVFEGARTQLAAATEALVHASLQRWLGDRLSIVTVSVAADAPMLEITVEYIVLRTGRRAKARFSRTT